MNHRPRWPLLPWPASCPAQSPSTAMRSAALHRADRFRRVPAVTTVAPNRAQRSPKRIAPLPRDVFHRRGDQSSHLCWRSGDDTDRPILGSPYSLYSPKGMPTWSGESSLTFWGFVNSTYEKEGVRTALITPNCHSYALSSRIERRSMVLHPCHAVRRDGNLSSLNAPRLVGRATQNCPRYRKPGQVVSNNIRHACPISVWTTPRTPRNNSLRYARRAR